LGIFRTPVRAPFVTGEAIPRPDAGPFLYEQKGAKNSRRTYGSPNSLFVCFLRFATRPFRFTRACAGAQPDDLFRL